MTTTQEPIDYEKIATELALTLRVLEAVGTGYIDIEGTDAETMLISMSEHVPLTEEAWDFLYANDAFDEHVERVKALAEHVETIDADDDTARMAEALAVLLSTMFDGDEEAAIDYLTNVVAGILEE